MKDFKMFNNLNKCYKIFFSVVLVALLNTNLLALNTPKSSKFDERITFATYNADDVVLIKSKEGYVSIIKFENDERVINIAVGFSQGWEVTDKDNYLFIRPISYQIKRDEQQLTDENGEQIEFYGSSFIQPTPKDWKTNLIVTTNKDKIYTFDLTIANEKEVNYKLSFNYEIPKAKLEEEKKKKELEIILAKEKAEFETEITRNNIPRNWDFIMHINKGSETIAPDYAYDDGVFTYLGFKSTKTIPSIFLYDEINKESMVNTNIKKDGKFDVVVVHKTTKKLLLRNGNKLVGIINQGYSKNPLDQTYKTNRINIKREIIER